MKVSAIIPAAGSGRRMGRPKQWLTLAGKPLLYWTLAAFERCPEVSGVVLVVPGDDLERVRREIVEPHELRKVRRIVAGGAERQDSVRNGFEILAGSPPDIVVVHDGARPLVTPDILSRAVEATILHGATLVAVPVQDTLKRVNEAGAVLGTLRREGLWQAQTPQSFRYELLEEAYEAAHREGFLGTDEAALVERLGHTVHIVEGSRRNFKVTTPEDIELAERLLKEDF